MGRNQFRLNFSCNHCGALGTAVWEENSPPEPRGPQRRLVTVGGEFHSEVGRTQSGDPLIVCNNCDTIQPD